MAIAARIPRRLVPAVVVGVGILLAGYLVATRPTTEPDAPAEIARPVRVIDVHFEDRQPELLLYGEIVAGREAEIRSMVAGRIVTLSPGFRSGAFVESAQELAGIDPFDYEIALRERAADLVEAEARLAELTAELAAQRRLITLLDEQTTLRERDLERVRNLASKRQTSEKALDDARLALNTARQQRVTGEQAVTTLEARVEQQQAAVRRNEALRDRAARDLADTTIAAPFAGYVQDILVATGKRVAVGESLGRLIDARGLEVKFELPNADYGRLAAASNPSLAERAVRVAWRLGDTDYVFDARIERTGAEVDSTSGGVMLYARLVDGPLEMLRPGAFVEVVVPDLLYESVLRLPETAVTEERVVYVIEDRRLVAHTVDIVREYSDHVLVRGEIAEGAAVVAEQFPGIGPGMLVESM